MKFGILIAVRPEAKVLLKNPRFGWCKSDQLFLYESRSADAILALSGIGKANASAAAAALCERCSSVINIGSAGSVSAAGGAVIADSFVEYDIDCGSGEGVIPFSAVKKPVFSVQSDSEVEALVIELCREKHIPLTRGCCASADRLVNSDDLKITLKQKYGAAVCDMEAAPAARIVSTLYGKPFTSIKFISDSASDDAVQQWKRSIAVIAEMIDSVIDFAV